MLVFHSNLSEHLTGLQRLLDRVRNFDLTIRPSKTFVATTKVILLVYTIRQGRIMPEPSLLKKIMSIVIPVTKRQVRSLLGLINFYSPFIPNYSEIMFCLTELTTRPQPDPRSNGLTNTTTHYGQYRQHTRSKPFLQLPDLSRDFVLLTDCSSISLSRVLCQESQEYYLCFRFISHKLKAGEARYPVAELEALALCYSVSKLSRYLFGRPFVIASDHKGLSILQ